MVCSEHFFDLFNNVNAVEPRLFRNQSVVYSGRFSVHVYEDIASSAPFEAGLDVGWFGDQTTSFPD